MGEYPLRLVKNWTLENSKLALFNDTNWQKEEII